MPEPILQINNFSSGYEDNLVLHDVSLKAYPGETVVIIGTSGCGKTTLLKHIIGLLKSEQGSVQLFNEDMANIDEKEYADVMKKVGVLFQNGALLNSITVGENISIPLEQHTNLPPHIIEKMVKLKLSLVGLSHVYNYSPMALSGGMRKRVALARALALDPEILFADEPGAGLDPVTARSLDDLLLSLRNQLGLTLIIVTHEVNSIKRTAEKICYLHEGKVLFFGTLAEALKSEIPEVKSFFATQVE